MKKIIISSLLAIGVLSCSKEREQQNNLSQNSSDISLTGIIARALPLGVNSETQRIYEDIQDPKYTVAIIDNPNYGKFSNSPQYDVFIGGKSKPSVSVKLNNVTYNARPDGQWLTQGLEFKNYFNKDVSVTIKDGEAIANFVIHVPKPALVNKLGAAGSLAISRRGNTLTWSADPNNLSGKVALHYTTYNNNAIGSEEGVIKRDILLLNDNGSFNLDDIISNTAVKKIYFRLVTGNTASVKFAGEKLLFHISSFDHHEYTIN